MSIIIKWLESLHFEVRITNRCTHLRITKASCRKCLDACPQQAISLKDNTLAIEQERCNGCGECVVSCPLSAIEGVPANRRFEHGNLLFTDAITPSVKELLIYKKRGLLSVFAQSSLNEKWENSLTQTNKLLNKLGEEPILLKTAETSNVSRRDFFKEAQSHGRKLVKDFTPAEWKINKSDWVLSKYYPDYQFYRILLDTEKCICCRGCFSVCPEGVFTIHENHMTVKGSKCVNCSLCQDVCTENAIAVEKYISHNIVQTYAFFLKNCQECGHEFYSFQQEKEKCLICSDRDPSWLKP